VCSSSIPSDERIITIEDSVELKLIQPHVVSLEGRPPNIEGSGKVTIRDLMVNTLRMRPDRIVVGEVRGAEAFDMLQAMNTGHDGSLSTIHANNPHDVISRLISMIFMAGIEMPVSVIREMIYSAVECVIQTARLSDGSRRVLSITELSRFKEEEIELHHIYKLVIDGRDEKGKFLTHYEYEPYGERLMEKIQSNTVAENEVGSLSSEKPKNVEDILKRITQVMDDESDAQ
jgi:pilus assembly protein CpaF